MFTEKELKASICRSSFRDFVTAFWDHEKWGDLIWNWHIEYLCEELQIVAERVFKGLPKLYDLVINISPGTTKSSICSVLFPAWTWTKMPRTRTIGASYSFQLAMDLARKSRDVIKSSLYHEYFPEIAIREDQDSKGYFLNTRGGDRFAVGLSGAVTGMHGHFIIPDDPIDPLAAYSALELATANRWVFETLASRKVDKRISVIIMIMQRVAQGDPTEEMLKRAVRPDAVKHICIPAELTKSVKPVELREKYRKGLMDPIRLNRDVLAEEHAKGEYYFSSQFLQEPVPAGGLKFDTSKLRIGRPSCRMKSMVRYWDKAGTQGGGKFTAGVKMGEDEEETIWILDVVRGQWNSSVREKKILSTAKWDGKEVPVWVEQEPGSGGKDSAEDTVLRLTKKGYRVGAHKVGKSDGDKEARADPFSVQVNGGNVWLVEAPWNAVYIEELKYFPMGKFSDQVDGSSGSYNKLKRPSIVVGGIGILSRQA